MGSQGTGRVVGVDVGGTFTDLVEIDADSGAVRLAKVPSTPDNQAFGVLAALDAAGIDAGAVDLIVHGTTTTTNAVLERKLSRTGLVTTEGFRDVLELGRRTRPQAYGMKGEFTPIIPRGLRLEVPERMDASGQVVVPLDEDAVRIAGECLKGAGCEAVVVHFLHAYANPAHERRAGEILSEFFPDHVTMGHALLSETREYERGVTAAVNASVQPILARYIKRLQGELAVRGYAGDLLVMNGNGGTVSASRVAEEAAKTVMSGPASGVMAAAATGKAAGQPNLITYDMGGTSTDVALIRDAQPLVSSEIELEYAMPIHVPMVDVRTVGAGGGSIARVNAAGLLEIGPDSAGADPGPICYGRGGMEPTISDANLILGRLDPARLAVAGGVTPEAVREIFDARIARPLGLGVEEAALAVIRVANLKMAGAVRMVSVSLGVDPRDFALFAFGGAGPLHATAIARELSIPKVLVPARPGITNAIGCVAADLRQDFVQTVNRPLRTLAEGDLAEVFADQAARGRAMIESERIGVEEIVTLHALDMQFVGQTHLLRVALPDPGWSLGRIREAFERVYHDRFRVELDRIEANVVNVATSVIGRRAATDLSRLIDPASRKAALDPDPPRRRLITESGTHDAPVYLRDALPLLARIEGPALIEQMDTTTLIGPGEIATGDAQGNILIEVPHGH